MRLAFSLVAATAIAFGGTIGLTDQAAAQWRGTCMARCQRVCLGTAPVPRFARPAYCNRRCTAQCFPWSTQTPQAPILVTPRPGPVPVFRSAPQRFAPAPAFRPAYPAPAHRPQVYRAQAYRPAPVYRPARIYRQPTVRASYPRQQIRGYPQTR